jgi:hypothetical protein
VNYLKKNIEMNKQKLRLFLKIFFLLLVIQLLIIVADVQLSNTDSSLSAITSFIISIFSFPIRVISPDLPFYSGEGIPVTLIFWMLNLVLQTMAIYGGIRMIKRVK